MPHLTLEYSDNVTVPAEISVLLNTLHTKLAEVGGIRIENFRTRVYVAERYFIGVGDDRNGFVHLDIRFLEGRPKEVRDIVRSCYFKHPEGTSTTCLRPLERGHQSARDRGDDHDDEQQRA